MLNYVSVDKSKGECLSSNQVQPQLASLYEQPGTFGVGSWEYLHVRSAEELRIIPMLHTYFCLFYRYPAAVRGNNQLLHPNFVCGFIHINRHESIPHGKISRFLGSFFDPMAFSCRATKVQFSSVLQPI